VDQKKILKMQPIKITLQEVMWDNTTEFGAKICHFFLSMDSANAEF